MRPVSPPFFFLLALLASGLASPHRAAAQEPAVPPLRLNEAEYFSRPGVDVMAFQDIYPEGHQGGVSLILNGSRLNVRRCDKIQRCHEPPLDRSKLGHEGFTHLSMPQRSSTLGRDDFKQRRSAR